MFNFPYLAGKILAALEAIAPLTPTKVDDEVVDLLNAIRDDEVIGGWLGKLIGEHGVAVPRSIEPPAEVVAAFEARKINWANVVTKLPVIIGIAQQFAALLGK